MIRAEYTKNYNKEELKSSNKSHSILHILFSINETSAPYNEHCLPLIELRKITICTYFKSKIKTPPAITLFDGDNSLFGFIQALKSALKANLYDIIHVHALHLMPLFQLINGLTTGNYFNSTVFTVHTSFKNYKVRHRLMLIPTFAFTRRVVYCSKSSYNSFTGFYKNLVGDRVRIVQNGVDIDRVDSILKKDNKKTSKNGGFVIASIGRLIPVKNSLTILEAFQNSAIPHSCLSFIGEGDLQEQLLNFSKKFKIDDQIVFTGIIPREQVYKYLNDTDLFVSASRIEGFPVSALEAMACGCPVVLSDIPPHRELADGIDFIPLLHPDDVSGFAQEIKRVYQMPASERKMLGQQCRKLVEERFSLKNMHQEYDKIYSEIING